MEKFPPAVIRALEGLGEGRGRAVVIAGPPFSGKSELLASLRTEVTARGFSRVDLRGSYRHRTKPFEALSTFEVVHARAASGGTPVGGAGAGGWMYTPSAPFGVASGESAGGNGAPEFAFSSAAPMPTGAGGNRILSATEAHAVLLRRFREEPNIPIVVLIEDAALFDQESRDAILYLLPKTRYRPILVVITLDVSLPAFQAWEERLTGRAEVDWVRFRHPKPDVREAERLREHFELLPESTQRVLLQLTLLGGSVPEVTLGRVTRMGIPALADSLAPAAAVNLIRMNEGRVMIPHDAWIDIIPGIVPETMLRKTHLEVAEALAAMTPEPDLKRRMELTYHYYEAARDPLSLRYLLETSEICDQLNAFDAAEGLLARALNCVASLPPQDQAEATAEVQLLHARSLAFSGRVTEGEKELHEGFAVAIGGGTESDRIEEWAELMLPVIRTLGPRPSLLASLTELADRCAEVNARGAEVLFSMLIAENEYEQGQFVEAQREANRAVDRARGLEPLTAQSASIMASAMFVAQGGYAVEAEEELFLATRPDAGRARRSPLAQMVEELQLRLVERHRDPVDALAGHLRAVPICQRLRAVVTELYHHLDIAEIELDEKPGSRTRDVATRAAEIVEVLHLIPPSPGWARSWLVQGRLAALEGRLEEARDIWGALSDRSQPVTIPRYRAEAILRLALLELSEGRIEPARALLTKLEALGIASRVPSEWVLLLDGLAAAAKGSLHGSGRLPTRPADLTPGPKGAGRGAAPSPPSPRR